jgi:hypothetical protein
VSGVSRALAGTVGWRKGRPAKGGGRPRPLDPAVRELVAGPTLAQVGTTMRDGAPRSSPAWVDVKDERLLVSLEPESPALDDLRRDRRLAISISAAGDRNRGSNLRGRVVEMLREPEEIPKQGALMVVAVEHAQSFEVGGS